MRCILLICTYEPSSPFMSYKAAAWPHSHPPTWRARGRLEHRRIQIRHKSSRRSLHTMGAFCHPPRVSAPRTCEYTIKSQECITKLDPAPSPPSTSFVSAPPRQHIHSD